MRFRDYDTMARLALAGTLASSLAYFLPWFTVRLQLQTVPFSGFGLVVAPVLLRTIGTPGQGLGSAVVALAAGIALIAALGGLMLALDAGLRAGGTLNRRAGMKLAAVGLGADLVALAAMFVWVGPSVGITAIEPAALLGLLGFALAAYAWPRAALLGDDEAHEAPPATKGPLADGPR